MEKRVANTPGIILSVFGAIAVIAILGFLYQSFFGPNYNSVYEQKINNGEIKNPISQFSLWNVTPPQNSGNTTENNSGSRVIGINTREGNKTITISGSPLGPMNLGSSQIEEDLLNYTSVMLKLYNLHNVPYTSNTPKIQVYIDGSGYSIEISGGDINVNPGTISSPDIIMRTTSSEIIKMISGNGYTLQDSIASGKTTIQPVASQFILFSKGYLSLYQGLSSS